MPPVETSDTIGGLFVGDASLVEGGMIRVLECSFCEPFVIINCAIANKLYLWLPGDGLKVWVQDGLLCTLRLVVAVSV